MACLSMVKAVLARGLFVIHSFITVWKVVDVKGGNTSYWFLLTGVLLLIFEGMVSICGRSGKELKWFCPSVFLYLCSIVPPLWILELDLAKEKWSTKRNTTAASVEKLSQLLDFEIAIYLPRQQWAEVLEQLLLVFLIVGRWLLPKGELSREQLSQLLLAYLGLSADIIELFEAFDWQEVIENTELTYIILGIWSWSLLQFTLVLTASRGRKPRLGMDSPRSNSREGPSCEEWADMDIIAIVCTVLLQDGPFLLLRLVLIFRYKVVSYMNIFFTCKNSLVTTLQLYRLFVLCCERQGSQRVDSEEDWESGSFSITESDPGHSSGRASSPCSATITEVSDEPPPFPRRRRHSPLPHRRRPPGPDTLSATAETAPSRRQLRRRQRLLQLAARQTSHSSSRRREGTSERRAEAAVVGRYSGHTGVLPVGLSSSESELDALRRAMPGETDDSASRAASERSRPASRSLSFQCLRELEHLQLSGSTRGGKAAMEKGRGRDGERRRTRPETLPALGRFQQEEALVHHSSPQSPTSAKSVSFSRSRHPSTAAPPTIHVQPPSRRMSIEVAPVTYIGRRSTRRDSGAAWRPTDGAAGGRPPSPMRAMNLLRALSKSISPVNGTSSGRQRGEAGRSESGRHRSRRKRQESYV